MKIICPFFNLIFLKNLIFSSRNTNFYNYIYSFLLFVHITITFLFGERKLMFVCALLKPSFSLYNQFCKPGTEKALCNFSEQLHSTDHGSWLALMSIINVKSLKAICWLKCVHVKHLSKTLEKQNQSLFTNDCQIWSSVSQPMGCPCYALKTRDLDRFGA